MRNDQPLKLLRPGLFIVCLILATALLAVTADVEPLHEDDSSPPLRCNGGGKGGVRGRDVAPRHAVLAIAPSHYPGTRLALMSFGTAAS